MRTCAEYLALAKSNLGNPSMSDRELGERLGGFSTSAIGNAKAGRMMSDPLALAVAEVLPEVDAGEILMVARLEREKDEAVKTALMAWASKTLAAMPSTAAARSALGGVAVAVALVGAPSPSQAQAQQSRVNPDVCIMSNRRRREACNDSSFRVAA